MKKEADGRVKTAPLVFIITAVSFAVYFNALFDGFVYDDERQVLANPWIKDINNIPNIFIKNVFGFEGNISNYYRPLMHVIYMVNYYIFGYRAWGFHLVNVFFNAGVSILVFLIIRRLLDEYRPQLPAANLLPALMAALLFTTHPVHTEAVTWVAGVPEVSFSFFYLLSLYFYIRYREGAKWKYSMSAAFFFIAALCKETALTLPLVLAVYDLAIKKAEDGIAGVFKRLAPYFALAGFYFALRLNALSGLVPIRAHPELNTSQYIINVFPLFAQYIGKLVLPFNLNCFHVFHPINSIFEPKGIFALAVTAGFIVLLLLAYRKNKSAFLGLSFIVIPLLPALYIPGIGENAFAERYLYLPSFGLVFLASLLIVRMAGAGRRAAASIAAFFILTGFYSIGTVSRNQVWHDSYSLWTDTVKKSPDSYLPHLYMYQTLWNMGRFDEAAEHFSKALSLQPRYPEDHKGRR